MIADILVKLIFKNLGKRKLKKIMKRVVVLDSSVGTEKDWEIVSSNVDVVNSLFNVGLFPKDIHSSAILSYFIDWYLAEMNNGGFSQFAYNSSWDKEKIRFVEEGLQSLGLVRNSALFSKCTDLIEELGKKRFKGFLKSEYFGDNEERDFLNRYNDEFFNLQKEEDISKVNSQSLRNHPDLEPMTINEIRMFVGLAQKYKKQALKG